MSESTALDFGKLSELKQSDRKEIGKNITDTLIRFQHGIYLSVPGPSYKLRYRYAVDLWKEKTRDVQCLTFEMSKAFIEELKTKLISKEGFNFEGNVSEIILDPFFLKPQKRSVRNSLGSVVSDNQNPVWYVTCKCKNVFWVIRAENCEDEREISCHNIPCSYDLIYHGDEVKVLKGSSFGDLQNSSVEILKSTGPLSKDAKATFITKLLDNLNKEGESCLNVYNNLSKRCLGIWERIKNDEELFTDEQCVRDVMNLSLSLSKKLSKKSESSCKEFLQDLSSSKFFIALAGFIENHAKSEDIDVLKSLLEIIMEHSPQTATKILKVAKHVVRKMHVNSIGGETPEENSTCSGVEYLVHLAMLLAKAVPGYQDVDTTNCAWNELPIIPTEKEINSEFDLKSMQPIKLNKPYDSVEQYLDVNFSLLREECFRDLCTGIRNFQSETHYDPRKMKIYKITLSSIAATVSDTQVLLELNCDEFSSEEADEENTSHEILYGSLMCISLNRSFDNLIWATVVKSEHQQSSHKKTVSVRLCSDRNKDENLDVLLELSAITNKGDHALMAESPTFYPAFGPSMKRLKEIHDDDNLPLVSELVYGRKSSPPDYITSWDKEKYCDWSAIFENPRDDSFSFPEDEQLNPIEQFKILKEKKKSVLDETQMKGIENFLNNRVSLIQGPPGTGKSFLGAKILHLMLSMGVHQRYGGPILIMTYKNFALDHFMESSLQYTSNIVRIGKAGKENLERINFRNVRKGIDTKLLQRDQEVTAIKRKSQIKLNILFKCLSNPIFSLRSFFQAASKNHMRSLLNSAEINVDQSKKDLEDLLSKWKPNTAPTEQLKALVRKSLKSWLPRDKIQERFGKCQRKVPESNQYRGKSSVSSPSTNEDLDVFDLKVETQERQQNAVESDCSEDDYETPSRADDLGDDGALMEDLYIPFVWENYEEEEQDVYEHLTDLWELKDEERVDFICFLQRKIVREFGKAVRSYEDNAKWHQDHIDDSNVSTLKEYDVIGMTVTGASLRLHLLDQLRPCAVIVEEAAEIIEGQLLSVLPPTIQHLVMIGDQEQLKPRVNCYQLRKMNLDCSMFERLINNELNFEQLGKQCRMRDDIADLLRSLNIYKDLKTNNEKTSDNIPPDCVGYSLLFVKHIEPEKKIQGSNSFWNQHEISIVLDVADHLMKNNYSPNHVTVLCAYSGQVKKMKAAFEKKSRDTTQEYYPKLKEIYITTVDSFQGDENKVILLSLVRSNGDGKIGFLNKKNRICVAISRAQCALYMFGNARTYGATSVNWKIIIKYLEDRQLVMNWFQFKEACDRSFTVEDGRSICTMKLSSREITRLSGEIVMIWQELASLEDIPRGDIENLLLDHVHYQGPKHKAENCLSMINEKPDFSRENLACHLEELKYDELAGKVRSGALRKAVLSNRITCVSENVPPSQTPG